MANDILSILLSAGVDKQASIKKIQSDLDSISKQLRLSLVADNGALQKVTGALKNQTGELDKQSELYIKLWKAQEKAEARRRQAEKAQADASQKAIALEEKALQAEQKTRREIEQETIKLQQQIENYKELMRIKSQDLKGKYGTLIDESELQKAQKALDNLNLKNFTIEEKTRINNMFKNIESGAKNSSKALKLAQQDARSFGSELLRSMTKFVEWIAIGTVVMQTVRLIREGISGLIELENNLNQVRIVTGMTQEAADKLAKSYNNLAKEMSVTTSEIAKAAVEFYRQGLGDSQVEERLRTTIEYAKISALSFDEAAQILTATVNSMEIDINRAADVMAYLGDATATGSDEIGRALQKVGGTAGALGIEYEKLGSWIAVVSSRTRESAESIGTSFKTILARLTNLKENGFDEEDATKINDVAKALNKVGISLTDETGQFRDFGKVIDELGNKWQLLTDKNLKAYLATVIAGTRQQARFYTLMDGYVDSLKLYEGALQSAGTAQEKYNIYQESTQAHLDSLKATFEGLWQNTINSETIKSLIDLANGFLKIVDNVGLLNSIIIAATFAMTLFNKTLLFGVIEKMAVSIAVLATNMGIATGAATALGIATSLIAPVAAVAAIIGLIAVIKDLNKSLSDLNQQTQETANKARENSKQIDEQIRRYKELNEKVVISSDEKLELIKIEKLLKDKYGETTEAIDLMNGSLSKNIELMNEAKKAEAERFLALNKDNYTSALKQMNGQYNIARFGGLHFFSGQETEFDSMQSAEEFYLDALRKQRDPFTRQQIEKILEKIQEDQEAAQSIIDEYESFYTMVNGDKFGTARTGGKSNITKPSGKADDISPLSLYSKEDYKKELDDIEYYHNMGLYSEEEYYKKLIGLRDKYYQVIEQGELRSLNVNIKNLRDSLNIETLDKDILKELLDANKITLQDYYDELLNIRSKEYGDYVNKSKSQLQSLLKSGDKKVSDFLELESEIFNVKSNLNKDDPSGGGTDKDPYRATIDTLTIYQQKLDDISTALQRNKILIDQTEGQDRIDNLKQRIALLEQQKQALHDINNANDQLIQSSLSDIEKMYGELGTFDPSSNQMIWEVGEDGLLKWQTVLKSLTDDEAKNLETAIKDISDRVKDNISGSTEWLNVNKEQVDLNKEILSIQEEQLEKIEQQAEQTRKNQIESQKQLLEKYKQQEESLKNIIDLTTNLIKQEYKDIIDKLEDQLDAHKEITNEIKKQIKLQEANDDYRKDEKKKQDEILKLQRKITELSRDDSRQAQAEKLKLEEDLAKKQEDLSEFRHDRDIELQLEALDEGQKAFEDKQKEEIDKYKQKLSEAGTLQQEAINRINDALATGSDTLYDNLITWNQKYGSSIQDDIVSAWKNAKDAMLDYQSSSGGLNIEGAMTKTREAQIIAQMQQNSISWHGATSEERIRLHEENIRLAKQLSGSVEFLKGKWWQNGIPIYGQGTYVDKPHLSVVGDRPEFIIPKENIMDFVNKVNMMNIPVPKMPNFNPMQNSNALKIDSLITINGNADRTILPDLERIANTVVDKINNGFYKVGKMKPIRTLG